MAETFGALVLIIWIYLTSARGSFFQAKEADLPRLPPKPPPKVAVIIPARNEAAVIARAVDSLAKQHYSGEFQIFVVDDHSEDETAELVGVVPAREIPPGWTGKVWAMAEGVRAAEAFRPDFYLFTDADIVHPADEINRLVGEDGDLVSLMVSLRCESFAERGLIPAFVFFFLKLYPPEWIADPRRDTAGAAGGCILLRREALERMGGLETIRGEIIDDCALANAVKRSGGRCFLGLTQTAYSLRRYETLRDVGRMISRTAFTQLRYSPLLLLGTVLGMGVIYLAPPLLLLTGRPLAMTAGGLAWLLMAAAYSRMLIFYRRRLLWAPALPLVALFYTGATVHSAFQYWRGRGGTWKGRTQARRIERQSS